MVQVLLGFAGGLGLFLYGMKLMGDSLEKAAGTRLRRLLEVLTNNRFLGILVGALFTAIIQSSSATTVMVVGFVNAGLMNLSQALGVILGANIGTTITGQIIALKLTVIAPILLTTGIVMILFFKNSTVRDLGAVLAGFGILFIGLDGMSSAMAPLRDNETFKQVLSWGSNPLVGILAGMLFTCVIQSSSASIGILQALAMQGLVGMNMGTAYLILGINIGTCITAMIASVGTSKNARRAALTHLSVNIFKAVVIGILLHVLPIISWITDLSADPVRQIANANTLFNIVSIFLFLPFGNWTIRLMQKVIPGEDPTDEPLRLQYLDERIFETPALVTAQLIHEVERMGGLVKQNIHDAVSIFQKMDEEKARAIAAREKVVNFLNHEITRYLVRANQLDISDHDKAVVSTLFHVITDMERIGDHAENIMEFAQFRQEDNLAFTDDALQEIEGMAYKVEGMLDDALHIFTKRDRNHARDVSPQEKVIDQLEQELRERHIARLNQGQCTTESGMMFVEIISNLERVGDHATNIAYSVLDT